MKKISCLDSLYNGFMFCPQRKAKLKMAHQDRNKQKAKADGPADSKS